MSKLENFLLSTKLNTLSLNSTAYFPKSPSHQASKTHLWLDNPFPRIGFHGFKGAILPKRWHLKLLNLPIGHLSVSTVMLSTLCSEGSLNNALVWADKLTAIMPAYPEWPLLFTTLRLVIAGVLS